MEKSTGDFQRKYLLPLGCDCGQALYVFFDSLNENLITRCSRCEQSVFFLRCQNCGVQANIAKRPMTTGSSPWACKVCGQQNVFPLETAVRAVNNYQLQEIPEEILKMKEPAIRQVYGQVMAETVKKMKIGPFSFIHLIIIGIITLVLMALRLIKLSF